MNRTEPITAIVVLVFACLSISSLHGCVPAGGVDSFARPHGTVTDIDGNTYRTVLIGKQWWMAEDLRTRRTADGKPILNGSGDKTGSEDPRYYRVIRNSVAPPIKSGEVVLYNWAAAVQSAPPGWHLPSLDDWYELGNYIEQSGLGHPLSAMLGEDSPSGFDAELSGAWFEGTFLDNYTSTTQFWSSTPMKVKPLPHAYSPHLSVKEAEFVIENGANVLAGWSVRYVKDEN